MKRNNSFPSARRTMRHLLPAATKATRAAMATAGIACLSLLAASCSDEDEAGMLPEGKYPMTFATAVEGLTDTRAATAEGLWTTTDRIAVKVGSDVKQYAPAAGGASATLQAAAGVKPFYWQASGETKQVSAWYGGTGYNATLPATWTVQSDQNANDGYQNSDFLYAAADITFAGRDKTPLTFYHQTARVVINIKNAEAATDAGQIRSVTIGNAGSLALSGSYTEPGASVTAGTWDISSATMGAITPKSITAAEGCLTSYAALVIPQDMQGKKFIAVTLSDGNTYYYTPGAGAADLQSGKQHTYDITVKYGYLEVTNVSAGGAWGGGTIIDTNAAPEFTVSVIDGGYASGSDYKTTFNAGDQIGLFAVKNNAIMSETNNLCLIAKAGGGGIVWTDTNGDAPLNISGATYYAYYPYQPTLTVSVNPNATTAGGFFANLINSWTPTTDQSTYAKYTAQDLMVAKGTPNSNDLSFSLQHQMGLEVIDFPRKEYTFSNTEANTPYMLDAQATFTGFSPYPLSNGKYCLLVKPSNGTFTGTYVYDCTKKNWNTSYSVTAGNYQVHSINGGGITTISHTLQAGDFYMNDGSLVSKGTTLSAAQKAACLGIVVKVGKDGDGNWKDYCDYRRKKDNSFLDNVHGYVFALYNANNGNICSWSPNNTKRINLYSDDKGDMFGGFWGYQNTQAIINTGGHDLQSTFPATYHTTIGYEAKYPAPPNSSGWFFPSSAQLWYCYAMVSRGLLEQYVNQAGGGELKNWYWSSSEYITPAYPYEAPKAYVMSFNNNGVSTATKDAATTFFVRSFLVF